MLFLTGLAGRYAGIGLPEGLHWLMHPLVLGASGLMLLVEFLADKIPGLDSFWDMISTLVRVPAGAALAAAVFGGDEAGWAAAAAVLGASLAATAHAAKFPEDVSRASGVEPGLPRGVANLAARPEKFDRLPGDADTIKAYVRAFAEG